MRRRLIGVLTTAVVTALAETLALAQGPAMPLTLGEAEARAVAHHPRVAAAHDLADAAGQTVREARAAEYPTIVGSLTAADAMSNSRIAAGGLNNPIILDRLAGGLTLTQLVTDFGRTSNLVATASLRQQSLEQDAVTDRAEVLLRVDRSYFGALRAQAIMRVADATVSARQLVVDQVTALAQSSLKSGLDVSFARVNLGEAQLLRLQAQNDLAAAFADLSVALGQPDAPSYVLSEEPLPPAPPVDVTALVTQALRDRPDVVAGRLQSDSAAKFAEAEHRLWFPTLSAIGAAGLVPYRQTGLNEQYSAIGINLNVPLTNGGLFSARHAVASLQALAEDQRVRDLENRVSRDVRVALLDAQTGFQRLELTSQLLDQAAQAEDLAEARYRLGLSSIIELTQAQLNKTKAEIEQASARYDFQARSAALRYETGQLK